jgi:hypothetical protein
MLKLTSTTSVLALRRICQDPQVKGIALPLLDRFYGSYAYPSLNPFPGCVTPNARQSIQAPGLLNCTALGAAAQRCQASGRKVLLSVKADGLEAVGGNANFGDIGTDVDGDGGRKRDVAKRQDSTLPYPLFPIKNLTLPIPSLISAPATPISTATSTPIAICEPIFPTSPSTLNSTTPFPNLFDERHLPSSLALTLFSLFGEGHTEHADLRPLGPDVPSPAFPAAFNATTWISPPSSALDLL